MTKTEGWDSLAGFLKDDVKVAGKNNGEGVGERLLLICKNLLVVDQFIGTGNSKDYGKSVTLKKVGRTG